MPTVIDFDESRETVHDAIVRWMARKYGGTVVLSPGRDEFKESGNEDATCRGAKHSPDKKSCVKVPDSAIISASRRVDE